MSRPLEKGVTYFPLRADFFTHEKTRLIKGEFGMQGIGIVIALLCDIYRDGGYYTSFGEIQRTLLAEALGSGVKPNLIGEVVNGCFRCGFFSKAVFDAFGVLTSAGIQRRFIRAASSRDAITIIEEYWLLDLEDTDDVPAFIRRLIVFKNITKLGNGDKSRGNEIKPRRKKQRKGNQTKPKESISAPDGYTDIDDCFEAIAGSNDALRAALSDFAQSRQEMRKPLTPVAAKRLCIKLQTLAAEAKVVDVAGYQIACLSESIERGWTGVFGAKEFYDAPHEIVQHEAAGYTQNILVDENTDLASIL